MRPKDKELAREEDYRDYEQRDIEEGWPYDDAAGERSRKVENAPYGTTEANFDSETNKGYTVTGVDERGQQERQAEPLLPGTTGREIADDLEERVMDALTDVEGISPESIDVRAEGTHVILEGDVDDMITAHRLTARALTVSGVGEVTNNLTIIGVDANMRDDD
jgi:osmotically-inducible protein OsmY